MAMPPAEVIWNLPEKELKELLDSQTLISKPRKIKFYAPTFIAYKSHSFNNLLGEPFPTISVTGNSCALNCNHCQGKVLQTMYPATTPERLYTLCRRLKQKGARECLISGGCIHDGSVPLERFLPTIAKIKRELGLTVLVHTGVINAKTSMQLKAAEVDIALIDIIGSDETIRQIYNLNLTTVDFENSLGALQDAGLAFVPHVTVGLHNGKLKGEFHALNTIAKYKPSAVVIIAFMPIHGTTMAKVTPSNPIDIARTAAVAGILMPKTPLALGCMRPKGTHRQQTDLLALKAGVSAIAHPTESVIEYAQNSGYQSSFLQTCCAQIYKDKLQ